MAQLTGGNKNRKHYIVAIGASAGGLEAIHDFFDNMAEADELSFVIIQHLSSDYKSLLVELISKHTPMKVFEAEDKMLVLKQCIYVIPNNKLISLKNGKLRLVEKDIAKGPSTAVDTFLYSLAEEYKECAIAVILSGAGSDGTRGIKAVKKHGGAVMVQDPLTAKFDGMPNSAIHSGYADLILPPEMMPEEIFKIVRGGDVSKSLVKNSGGPLLDRILQLVHQHTGFDFQYYKKPTIQRRINKHMAELNINGLEKYVSRLADSQQDIKELGKSFLIGVTKFFRDQPAFDVLSGTVIPNILKTKQEGELIKVWVSACSTGEEAYSIAIAVDQCLQQQKKRLEVKIFATDIDEASLDFASKNIFPLLSALEGLEKQILEAYFEKSGKKYSVIPRIRKQIVFAKHNIIKDPPYINNDLVSCRNMLIYMSPVLQQKILSKLYFSVCRGAYLFLGPSESALSLKEQLTEVDGKWKIFQKTGEQRIYTHDFYKPEDFRHKERGSTGVYKKEEIKKGINEEFSELLFDDFDYAAFYIDSLFDIKEAAGAYKKYLSLPDKKLNLNLLKMLPPALSGIINAGVRKARKEKQKVRFKNVQIETAEKKLFINLIIKPGNEIEKNYTLIVINENADLQAGEQTEMPVFTADEQSEYVFQLESELDELREKLQLFKENHETINEELQSSNEELLSANEELQSSNEELQSLNEELHTLNTEHQMKIKELLELNNDLDNYFRSTDIGQLFLDSSLRIRKFNPSVTHLVNLISSDIGRPFSHISTNFKYDQLLETIQQVQQKGEMAEKEVQLNTGGVILIKIFPYVRHDKVMDGVILTFIDISALAQLNSLIKGVFNSSLNPIMAFKSMRNSKGVIEDFQLLSGNEASYQLINNKKADEEVLTLKKSFPQLLYDEFFNKYSEVVATSRPLRSELLLNEEGTEEWYEAAAAKMLDGFVVTLTNVTERKNAEAKLKKNYNELLQAREKLKKLNVTLEDKVKKRTEQLSSSEERFRLVAKASNDVIWDWNLVTNEVWWNESLKMQFGYAGDKNTSNRSFWLKNIHPDDRKRVERKIFDAINNGESMWSDNYRFQKADGSYAYIFDRGYLIYDQFNVPFRMLGSMLNVTELHAAEERIKRSETKFRRIFESNMLGMLFSDFEGKVFSANDYFLNMLGYTASEVEAGLLNWNKITPEKYKEVSQNAVKQLSELGVSKPFEKEYIKKDGQLVPVLIGSAAINQDENVHAVTYVIDVTDRKKAEARERQMQEIVLRNQEKLRFLADAAPQKIWTALPDGQLEYFNKVWVDYTGIKLEELQNEGWKGLVHPDDLRAFNEAWKKALKTGEGIEVEQRLRSHDGRYRWHLTRSTAQQDKEGNITMWVGSSTDIHEQKLLTEEIKASEFYFRQLADKSPFMIWKVDEQGLCNYVNVQWIELTGLSFEESLGTGWQQAFHPDDAVREYKKFLKCFRKRTSYHSKFRLNVKDGSSRWVIAQSNPLINDTFEGYIGSITDITDQEMAQESLKVLMLKKDEFMSIASHELKTPITSMKASLQIVNRISAKNNTNNPVLTEFVNRASKQADKLSILVADLLDVTKIHAGKMTLNKTKINIKEVITECAEQIQAIESAHTIQIDVKPKLYVNADRHRIEQVIINFLSNAVKYSPNADKVIITAKSYQNKIRVEVKDFGIGIPKDKIHFLFSRFFRVQESSQKFSGLGLGLYISAEMIKKHDGIIGVESEDGQGSTFWFELPAVDKKIEIKP